MALLFSHVRLSTPDGNDAEFLVSGIPREFDDFEYYTAFEDFLDGIGEDTEISVHAEAYLYGEGEPSRRPLRKWHTSIFACNRTRTSSQVIATILNLLNLLTSPATTLPMNSSVWIGGDISSGTVQKIAPNRKENHYSLE